MFGFSKATQASYSLRWAVSESPDYSSSIKTSTAPSDKLVILIPAVLPPLWDKMVTKANGTSLNVLAKLIDFQEWS